MSLSTQRDRLLAALKRRPMTTAEIREQLGIGMPATRVYELRHEGEDIETEKVEVRNRFGELSRVARYHYRGKVKQGSVAA